MSLHIKILHAIPGLSIHAGGPSRSVSELCSHLADRGLDVSLVRSAGGIEEIGLSSNIRSGYFQTKKRCLSFEMQTFDIYNFDLCHSHSVWTPFTHSFTRFAQDSSFPLVVSTRGMLEPWALQHKRLKKTVAWCLYQHRDLQKAIAFHATSMSEAGHIRKLGFKQPIAVIPNGVDLPKERGQRLEVRGVQTGAGQELGKNTDTKTALFLSRIHPKKGLPLLIEAWAQVKPQGWRLVIAGNDDAGHETEMKELVQKMGIQKVVVFPGPLYDREKEKAYREADLFVLPTYSENFGIVVAEALAYGIPVLTTTGTPWQELSSQGCGWCVPPTVQGITLALLKATTLPLATLREMGNIGRSYVDRNFQWPSIAESFEIFYRWLLNQNLQQPDFVI